MRRLSVSALLSGWCVVWTVGCGDVGGIHDAPSQGMAGAVDVAGTASGLGGMVGGGGDVPLGDIGGSQIGGEHGGEAGSIANDGGAGGAPSQPITTLLVHPGILNSASELAFLKAQLVAKREPWLSAFNAVEQSSYGALGYVSKPYAVVECGSYNTPNIGCSQMVDDGMAAYAQALLWTVTGKQEHAAKAKEIIDGWAKVYQKNLQSNSNLVVGWATPWYANAAELLRYSSVGLTDEQVQAFSALLQLWLPYVNKDEGPANNWTQSRIEAQLAIAVFLDDPAELERALARFRAALPSYILDSGLGMETCRDLGHLGLGVRSIVYAAETGWQQGTDLFGPNKARFAKFIELHGNWMLGKAAVPSDVCGGKILAKESDAEGIKPPNGGGQMPLEILYAHLHGRLGMDLPNLREMLLGNRPVGPGHWVLKWETLTHGQPL